MLMNLLIVKEGKNMWSTHVHSNYHHLKVLKEIVDHFKYNFLGENVGNKNDITAKELMKKIDKIVEPYEIHKWVKGYDLRKQDRAEREYGPPGYIIMDLSVHSSELYVNIGTSEPDDNLVLDKLKIILKELKKK